MSVQMKLELAFRRLASAAVCCRSVYPANIFFKCFVCISERPKRKITVLGPLWPYVHDKHTQAHNIGVNNKNNNGAQIYGLPTRLEAGKDGKSFGWDWLDSWPCVCSLLYPCRGYFNFVMIHQTQSIYNIIEKEYIISNIHSLDFLIFVFQYFFPQSYNLIE